MKKLLYLAARWPEPASSAAGSRSLQLLSLFAEHGWRITLMCAAEKRPHSAELPDGVSTLPLTLNDSGMDRVFADLRPRAVLFDRFMTEEQYGWRIENHCPDALRILDTVDLHSLREIRRRALSENRNPTPEDWFSEIPMRELASIHRSDLTLLISDAEQHILTRELKLPGSLFRVLPFLLDRDEQGRWARTPPFSGRRGFATIGNFRHPPNTDSLRWLKSEIWPQLREQCPGEQLNIYGADLTPDIRQLHDPATGFHIHGRTEAAVESLQTARVCLAPLRFGAGLKGKLLDAMLAGTPSVTTPVGVEGMRGGFPWPGAVASDARDIAAAAADLHQHPDRWREAQQRIPALLRGRFDRDSLGPDFMKRIHGLIEHPRRDAPERLTGALLRHHQHRSTEYFSRWIEAKNRSVD